MASDGVSCCSRRSGGVGREEQFAEGSGRKGKDDKDGVSPKCFCGEHAIMFMSKTSSNPNRLFLGCPFYKVRQLHCKFFLWLDEHIGRLGLSDSSFQAEKELGDVEEDEWKHYMEKKIICLEKRIVALESKKNPVRWYMYVIIIVLIAGILRCKN